MNGVMTTPQDASNMVQRPILPPIGPTLTVDELAAMLQCSPRSIYSMVDAGRIPAPLKLGRLNRWLRSSIDAWLAGGMKSVRRPRAKK